jgi:hypothetical protein
MLLIEYLPQPAAAIERTPTTTASLANRTFMLFPFRDSGAGRHGASRNLPSKTGPV